MYVLDGWEKKSSEMDSKNLSMEERPVLYKLPE
jgi:hypothetical protein